MEHEPRIVPRNKDSEAGFHRKDSEMKTQAKGMVSLKSYTEKYAIN